MVSVEVTDTSAALVETDPELAMELDAATVMVKVSVTGEPGTVV
jgi:hypothetical protein